jgi:hypothetical protein
MVLLMHLFISHLDPISIESVAPQSTLMIISSMRLMAINAPSRMRAQSTLRGRAKGVAGLMDPLYSNRQGCNDAPCDEVPCI